MSLPPSTARLNADEMKEATLMNNPAIGNRAKIFATFLQGRSGRNLAPLMFYLWSFVDGKTMVSQMSGLQSEAPAKCLCHEKISKNLKAGTEVWTGLFLSFMQVAGLVVDDHEE